ncbi:MAG TPA: DUF501 domain-containing protein [Ilumatobacter sp.]|nr:DUF501 domain-containing protein [Ilumatobacter sp.]
MGDGTDAERVRELLGREPQGQYEVVVRDADGDPVVLKNSPFMDDGTPMPTRYWLISPEEIRRVGTLEAAGGVNAAEAAIDPAEIADAHARYAAERDADIDPDHQGPRPFGGVAGTRVGVKCLHAHWAWHLAGGDDPVGRWVEAELARSTATAAPTPLDRRDVRIVLDRHSTAVRLANGDTAEIPIGPSNLTALWLIANDPPRPEDLTNALGTIEDHLDDVEREHPTFKLAETVLLHGVEIEALARLEVGSDVAPTAVTLDRASAEEVFRMVATENRAQRAHNPGLPSDAVGTIVATCIIVLALMRRLKLFSVTLVTEPG